jgi:hypothetical protein
MPLWQRLLVTLVAMIAVSFIVGLIWGYLFGFTMPAYLSGLVGGLTALPVWEFLKRDGPNPGHPPSPWSTRSPRPDWLGRWLLVFCKVETRCLALPRSRRDYAGTRPCQGSILVAPKEDD